MTGALHGLKILDFTTLYPGPLATVMLADLGAEVLRVEAMDRPDLLRYMPPYDSDGEGAAYRLINRNKRSIAINLKSPQAPELLQQLVQKYDIVVEQFRPGVLDRLGVGYEALREAQPRLIWCAITGYGQTGPYRDRPGHDINYLASSGVASHTGREPQGPVPSNILLGDVGGGTFGAVTGILAAVIQRQRTGRGQFVDIAMADGALWLNALATSAVLAGDSDVGRGDAPLNGGSAYDYYQTRDGHWLAVGALEPKFWRDFCATLGHPELENADTESPEALATLKAAIASALATRDLADWQPLFDAAQCCVDPVLTTREALAHPQFAARQMIVQVPLPSGKMQSQVASPIHLSDSPSQYRHVAAQSGEHTLQVLRECGLDAAEIAELIRSSTVSNPQD